MQTRSVQWMLLNTADFPLNASMTVELDPFRGDWLGKLVTPDGLVPLSDVTAVYYRKPLDFEFPAESSGLELRFVRAQARVGIGAVLANLPVRWVSPRTPRPTWTARWSRPPRPPDTASPQHRHPRRLMEWQVPPRYRYPEGAFFAEKAPADRSGRRRGCVAWRIEVRMDHTDDVGDVGRRLREIRSWRGLSLRVAAELSGLSYGYLGELERGDKPITKRHVLESLARTLRVSPSEITGTPYAPTDPVEKKAHAALREVETVLSSLDLGTDPGVRAAPWPKLAQDVHHLNTVLRVEADYAAQGKLVPDLLTQLHAAYVQQSQYRQDILVGLIHTYHSAVVLTKNLGVRGFPVMAARMAEQCAQELNSPQWTGFATWLRGHSSGSQGRLHQYGLSVRGVDQLTKHLDNPNVLQTAGMLHLNAALAAAAQSDGDTTKRHLDEAADLANRLPDNRENFGFLHFGSENVGIWRVSLATELGEGPKVAELAKGIHPEAIPAKARQGMFWSDLGRALVSERRTRERGLAALITAEKIAPQRVRNNVFVREAVADLLRQARRDAGGAELRGLAWRMGVVPNG